MKMEAGLEHTNAHPTQVLGHDAGDVGTTEPDVASTPQATFRPAKQLL